MLRSVKILVGSSGIALRLNVNRLGDMTIAKTSRVLWTETSTRSFLRHRSESWKYLVPPVSDSGGNRGRLLSQLNE